MGGGVQTAGGGQDGVQPGDLTRLGLGFCGTDLGFGPGNGGRSLGAIGATPRQVERVPAKAETAQDEGGNREAHEADREPTQRRQRAQHGDGGHGNTRRSSSKCGPSRRVGQSPPQIRATPCSLAAVFTVSAMRG